MKNRNYKITAPVAVALAMILGTATANAKDVYLQAGEFEKTLATQVQDIAIVNPDFESPNISSCTGVTGCTTEASKGNYINGSFSGWTASSTGGLFRPTTAAIDLPVGAQIGWAANGTSLSQTVSGPLVPGNTYTLSVDVGMRKDTASAGARVALWAGSVEVGFALVDAPATSGWQTVTVPVTGVTGPVEIRLTGSGSQTEFDNVRLFTELSPVTATMWGYSLCDATWTCGPASSPGPQIDVPNDMVDVPNNEVLNIYLKNTLDEPTSLMIAGQKNAPLPSTATRVDGRLQSFVPEVAALSTPAAGTPSYTFTDLTPGAFLYQSGSFVAKQVQMGLYGAVTKDAVCDDLSSTAPCAYGDVPYDASQVLVFSEIDPALHDPTPKAANATLTGYVPRFFLINGESYTGATASAVASSVVFDGPAVTGLVSISNGDFESPDISICTVGCTTELTYGNYINGSFSGWTASGTGGLFRPDAITAIEPSVVGSAQVGWAGNGTTLRQVLSESAAADTTYTLRVQVGQRNDTTRGDATISLLAGGVPIGSTVVQAPLVAGTNWAPAEVIVDTTGVIVSGALEIVLSGTGGQTEFDNVTLERTGPSARGSRILLRMINAGLENHAPQMLGGYFDVIAEDGHRSPVHKTLNTAFLPAAKSLDLLFTPDAAGVYPLFDRRLRLVNDTALGGGMFHQIVVE